MITTDEVQLSKLSYTDKDFASLYPDLLTLAKQLTNKWDPSLSNESDPGVVLLKEAAFVGDHNNYNIDKNVLENFLPSATQETSVANIVEMNGYTPRYYVSATGKVNVSYTIPSTEEGQIFTQFTLPAFTLKIQTDDGITYTQAASGSISSEGTAYSLDFIEGTISDLTINGSTTILLENLDNNRLYFPSRYVAQNGIFVKNVGDFNKEDFWERVEYLQTQPLKSKVYKVGYDSEQGVPYVEFPSDMYTVIGQGITVSYINTTGESGNIASGKLNKVVSPDQYQITSNFTLKAENFTVSNPSDLSNGKNPETIDEMYNSFKKIVGTFDTLVTCLDYQNAVNSMTDSANNQNLVGNCVVTDISNDYNNTTRVITYDEYGEYFENISLCRGINKYNFRTSVPATPQLGDIVFDSSASPATFKVYTGDAISPWVPISYLSYDNFTQAALSMNPYDLCMYALKAFSIAEYNKYKPNLAMSNSFTPIDNQTVSTVKAKLQDNKCISHTFKDVQTGDIYCFKNFVPLKVIVTPYNKVTKDEKAEIINNIYIALSENFNSSKLEFGKELDYDSVHDVILNADTRIKTISLNDFEYKSAAMKSTASGYSDVYLSDDSSLILTMIAKNVLAGRVCLFNFIENELNNYTEVQTMPYEDIVSIATESKITTNTRTVVINSDDYTDFNLDQYEGVVKVKITQKRTVPQSTITIPSGSSHVLASDETVYVKPEDYPENYYSYNENQVIEVVNESNSTLTLTVGQYVSLTSGQEIIIRITSKSVISEKEALLQNYEVKQNEYIQVAYPNCYSDVIYPAYAYYRYTSDSGNSIQTNVDYTLGEGDQLVLNYVKNNVRQSTRYANGDIIKFISQESTITPFTDNTIGTKRDWSVDDAYGESSGAQETFKVLTQQEQVEHRALLKTVISGESVPCYWIRNNNGNILFHDGETEVMLNTGEYFIYSNSAKTDMGILGPGTKLYCANPGSQEQWTLGDSILIKDVYDNGYNSSIVWKYIDFSAENKHLELQEMNILTLGEGDLITISKTTTTGSEGLTQIDNTWQLFNGEIRYKVVGDTSYTTLQRLNSGGYRIRSRLDIDLSDNSQRLLNNGVTNQSVTITVEGQEEPIVISSTFGEDSTYIGSEQNITLIGGSEVNIKDLTSGSVSFNLREFKKQAAYYHQANYVELPDNFVFDAQEQYVSRDIKKLVGGLYLTMTTSEKQALKPFGTYAAYKAQTVSPLIPKLFLQSTVPGEEYIEKEIEAYDGKYIAQLNTPGYITLPFNFRQTVSSSEGSTEAENSREYILPIYHFQVPKEGVSGSITICIADPTTHAQDSDFGLQDFAIDSPQVTKVISTGDDSQMYLYKVVYSGPYSSEGTVEKDVELKITINGVSQDILTMWNPKVYAGINKSFNTTYSLSDVVTKIQSIIANSTNPKVKPYYIYEPASDIAMQIEDFKDPAILWDPNNVVNQISIPQIDLDLSDIDINKSMRNYK